MTVPAQRPADTPTPSDNDNRYAALQHKLTALATAMDTAQAELGRLYLGMNANADRASTIASHIAHADLDPVFVEMTNSVSLALGGAAIAIRKLTETARDVAHDAHEAQGTHSKLYSGLDQVRSGRREKTPKPGFFVR